MYVSKEKAKAMLEYYKNDTCYFNEEERVRPISAEEIVKHLMEAGYGRAEANVITSALILAGALFTEQMRY